LNIFPVATGMEEHRLNAFLEEQNGFVKIYHAHISGGVSNVSFRLEEMIRLGKRCTRFLVSCIQNGMTMGIVNPEMLSIYDEIQIYWNALKM
jgi:5-methyltetrahydrofolate--homocysteine methyltransferase